MSKKFTKLSDKMKELLVDMLKLIKNETAGKQDILGFDVVIVAGDLDSSNPEFKDLPQQIKDTIIRLKTAGVEQRIKLRDILGSLLENYIAGKL